MKEVDPFFYCFDCMNRLQERNGVCHFCGKDNRLRKNGEDELPFAYLDNHQYTVGKALGRGGFGITYIGLNNALRKRVAIKEYFPANTARRDQARGTLIPLTEENRPQFEQGRNKVLNEARTIARMEDITNVVRIYDCFTRNNTVYIVMEYVEGETLASYVERKGPLPWQEAWRLMEPIGRALHSMHEMELVHRDVSPDNIMIRQSTGESVLLDFGAASAMMLDGRKHANLMKDGYAAIEQYREDSIVDGRTDEYSWAATLYYALTGKRPESAMQRAYNPQCTTAPRKLKARISKAAEQALMKGMAVLQDERYETMSELMDDLAGAGASSPRRKPWSAAVIAAAGLVCVGAISAGMLGETPDFEKVALVDSNVPLYAMPQNGAATFLNKTVYCSVINASRDGGQNMWYEVCIPVEGVLRTYYLEAGTVEMLDEGSTKELRARYQLYNELR